MGQVKVIFTKPWLDLIIQKNNTILSSPLLQHPHVIIFVFVGHLTYIHELKPLLIGGQGKLPLGGPAE